MSFKLLAVATAAALLCGSRVKADEIGDLKAEIAAQRRAADVQRARLDALEQQLARLAQGQPAGPGAGQPGAAATAGTPQTARSATLDQPAPSAAATPAPGLTFTQGEGLSYATATSAVTLYGLIDVTYVRSNHADGSGDSLFSPRVSWMSGNRWGLTGRHAMGDSGLNMIFRLESEFENQTGNMDTPGVLFNRDAWVGMQSDAFGKLTLGRQNAIGRDPASSAIYGDPYGPAAPSTEEGGYTNNNNFKQLIFYAGSATGTRVDNGVVWKKAFDNGLVAAAEYQFGGIPGDFNNGSTKSASLAYGGGFFNVAGFATAATVAGLSDRSYSIGGNYLFGTLLRVNAGYYRYRGEQGAFGDRRDNAYTVSAKLSPRGSFDYELGYQNMRASNAGLSGGGNVLNAFANASNITATATGSRATLYGSIFYHFDKITEVYVAADYLKLRDGYTVGGTNGFGSQAEFALGLRTRF